MQVGTIPASEEALVKMILNDEDAKFNSADLNVAYKMSVDEYYKKCEYAEALEENWGKAPGQLNTNGQDLLIFGKQFGNVFIGVQPTFGYEGDPMRLLFSRSASPHHGFAAYYTFLEKVFEADAVLHFGTHGSLEFMPGKQVGMAGTCYPDNLIGNIPNLYYYAANNPSEATIAKRRSYANTISYLTPPAENAGLYKGLKELKELISSYQVSFSASTCGLLLPVKCSGHTQNTLHFWILFCAKCGWDACVCVCVRCLPLHSYVHLYVVLRFWRWNDVGWCNTHCSVFRVCERVGVQFKLPTPLLKLLVSAILIRTLTFLKQMQLT